MEFHILLRSRFSSFTYRTTIGTSTSLQECSPTLLELLSAVSGNLNLDVMILPIKTSGKVKFKLSETADSNSNKVGLHSFRNVLLPILVLYVVLSEASCFDSIIIFFPTLSTG